MRGLGGAGPRNVCPISTEGKVGRLHWLPHRVMVQQWHLTRQLDKHTKAKKNTKARKRNHLFDDVLTWKQHPAQFRLAEVTKLRKAPKICRDMKQKNCPCYRTTQLEKISTPFFSNSHCRRPSVTLAKHHRVLFASLVVSLVRTHMSSSTDKQNSYGNFDRAVDKSTLSSTGTRVLLNVNVNRQYKSKYCCTIVYYSMAHFGCFYINVLNQIPI